MFLSLSAASAAVLFSADLQSASSNLNVASEAANRNIVYTAAGAAFGTAASGDNGRNILRTNDTDYNSISYVAEVTANWTSTSTQAIFFGMGKGMLGRYGVADLALGGSAPADQKSTVFPAATSHIALSVDNNVNRYRINGPTTENAYSTFSNATSGLTRFQLIHDANADTLVYKIDFGYTGTFNADFTSSAINIASYDFSTGGAAIYFEGDDGLVFRDFQVTNIPEPTTAMIGGLGVLLLLRRRRCA